MLFGVSLIAWPAAGLLSLMWLVGSFAMVFGVLMCLLAIRLKGMAETLKSANEEKAAGR